MSNEHPALNATEPDAIDRLLTDAFDSALLEGADANLADRVMARIARQQRQRHIVLALAGFAAAAFSVFSILPVLGLVEGLFSVLAGGVGFPDWQDNLPGLVLVLVIGIGISWLVMEEDLLT